MDVTYIVEFFNGNHQGWEILTESQTLAGALEVWARELKAGQCDVRISSVGNGNETHSIRVLGIPIGSRSIRQSKWWTVASGLYEVFASSRSEAEYLFRLWKDNPISVDWLRRKW